MSNEYENLARKTAEQYGIPAGLFVDLLKQQNPTLDPRNVNKDGTGGIASLSPDAAEKMGVSTFDPYSALTGAAKLFKSSMVNPQNKTHTSIENDFLLQTRLDNTATPNFNPDISSMNSILGNDPYGAISKALVGDKKITADSKGVAVDAGESIDDKPFWKLSGKEWGEYFKRKGITFLFFVLALGMIVFSIKTFIESQK